MEKKATSKLVYGLAALLAICLAVLTFFVIKGGKTGPQGQTGADGISITGVFINEDGHLIIDLSKGESIDAGAVKGSNGLNGENGIDGKDGIYVTSANVDDKGHLIINLSDNNMIDAGRVLGGIDGKDGENGKDGVSIVGATVNESGHLIVTLSNGTDIDSGKVVGDKGETGDQGLFVSGVSVNSDDHLIVKLSDNSTLDAGNVRGPKGDTGLGIKSIKVNEQGHLIVTYTDDTVFDAGQVRGETGVGISSIKKTSTKGLVDTYTITYTNGNTATFTVTNGAQGAQGIQGEAGKDGKTPVISIGSNGNWYIDGVDSKISAKGDKGEQGDDGLSAFEIYKKYHPEYTGSEETWINSLKGADGAQGVSVTNAYIDSSLHLWLVLSNGTKIDAGYVGTTVIKTYTVVFKDYDGTVLKTESVYENESATAPTLNGRLGYRFIGWSKTFDKVTSNLEVVAQYTAEHNQFYFVYSDNGNNTLTATLKLCGDVNLYGLECSLGIDSVGLKYNKTENKISGLASNYNAGKIKLSYVCDTGSNVTQETTLIEITFDITGTNYSLEFTLQMDDIFDEEYNNETYALANATYIK